MGDDQRRRTRIERAEAVEHVRLARRVERGRGFVEDEQGRAPKQRPGQYQPLAFASRQLTPAVADAFIASRFSGGSKQTYGQGLERADTRAILARASPHRE